MFDRKAYITTYVVHKTRSVLDRNLNFAYSYKTHSFDDNPACRMYMSNCERGVGQGQRSPVDGGEIESNQHPFAVGWSPGGAGGAIANGGTGGKGGSSRGDSGGTRPCIALSAWALFQELGVAMAAWNHSASAVHYPHLGLDCTMGQLTVIMGGVDDVVDDVDINNADVAGRRRRIRWLELRLSPRRRWWQAGGGELGGAATTTSRERRKA